MIAKGLDYAWGRPGGKAVKDAGYHFVCRYLSHTDGKNLSSTEAQDLISHGIDIVLVWETTADRAKEGTAAGRKDAQEAHALAISCGMPANALIYFAVDFDATGAQVDTYFAGIKAVLGVDRTGVYGGYKVVRHLLDYKYVRLAWQTRAWSNGQWDSRVSIRQLGTVTINGVSCDINEAYFPDYGQWSATSEVEMVDVWKTPLTNGDKTFTAEAWLTYANRKVDTVQKSLDAVTAKLAKAPSTAAPVIDYPKFVAEFIRQMGAK